ncbi:(Fe-S)-binding protein [candidate division KSB1 bacterium]|nr:(Fe-S)-binding protein [candidate division KSB1 bacterium]
MKVSLFIPCLTELMFPESGLAMVKVLKHIGAEIDYVEDQTCCGQPAFNSGYRKEIIPVAERFIDLFKDKEIIVAPSGSCTAMVRVFYHELDLNPEKKEALQSLSQRLFEFTEFLVDQAKVNGLGGSFPHRVTYHESCHLSRELGVKEQPRKLIRGIKDIDFVEMEKPDTCCGFGGTFSYKFPDLSIAMVARKCRYIEESGAEYVIGADSSCLMNIQGYLEQHKMKAKTMHIAELLAASLKL